VDISVPSFPDISDYFNISDSLTQMTISVNFVGFCISSALYGPLSDAIGRRRIMLIGNAVMMLGALGCCIANSIEFLLFARFVQGVGASASAVVVFAMIADVYSAEKSAKLIGTMNSLLTVFMSLAPIAGSFLNELVGWRGNFSAVALVSIISWLMLYFLLPETKSEYQPLSAKKIMRDFKTLFLDKRFLLASSVPSLYYAGWMSFVSCSSFLYMETYRLPIMDYALHQGAIIGVFSFTSLYSGEISQFIGEKKCVIYGTTIACIVSLLMFILSLVSDKSPYLTSLLMMTYGVGSAISYPIIFSKSLEIFPKIKGTASSAIMAMRALICAWTVAISSYFYSGHLITVAVALLIVVTLIILFSRSLLQQIVFVTKEDKVI
jgi:DHA1 family bicyclomycin/chloramphenicol resistance-like MFS transporter